MSLLCARDTCDPPLRPASVTGPSVGENTTNDPILMHY
jgi:hypothetical protein